MNPELKSLLARGFKYFYAVTLITFFISILILIARLGMKKEVDWNGVLILYGILIPTLFIFKLISKKLK